MTTVTLRARWMDAPPTPGALLRAPRGETVYRIVAVTRVRVSGEAAKNFVRLVCEPVPAAHIPAEADVRPWPRDTRAPRPRSGRSLPTADPGPAEPPSMRLDRIRAKAPVLLGMALAAIRAGRANDDIARLARVARVGSDDGVQHGRDHGPGIRLRAVRGRRSEVLRAADVEVEDGPDPSRPNRTVRRARRVDPLRALKRVGTLTDRHIDATERLREQMEAAEASLPCGDLMHVPSNQRAGYSDWQINNRGHVRRALAAVAPVNQGPVLWVAVGGTVAGFASYARVGHETVSGRLQAGLGELADHYYGPVCGGPGR